jgi:hypothetical protein
MVLKSLANAREGGWDDDALVVARGSAVLNAHSRVKLMIQIFCHGGGVLVGAVTDRRFRAMRTEARVGLASTPKCRQSVKISSVSFCFASLWNFVPHGAKN